MEISSMTRTSTDCHRARAPALPSTLGTSFSAPPLPRPTPAQLWSVQPPMLDPAMPVLAVIATSRPLALSAAQTCERSTDFPVPASPVTKRFSPRSTRSSTRCCSAVSVTSDDRRGAPPPPPPPPENAGGARGAVAMTTSTSPAAAAGLLREAAAGAGLRREAVGDAALRYTGAAAALSPPYTRLLRAPAAGDQAAEAPP